MKGFKLSIKGKQISGAIENGITGITITSEKGQCRVFMNSLNETGLLSYTWYSADLEIGDSLSISFEDITDVSEVQETVDHSNPDEIDKQLLKSYYKWREELITEGLISK